MSGLTRINIESEGPRRVAGDAPPDTSVRWVVNRGERAGVLGRTGSKIHRVAPGGGRTVCGVVLGKQLQLRRGTWEVTCDPCNRQKGPSYMGIREAREDSTGILTGETHYLWPKRKVTRDEIDAEVARFTARGGTIRREGVTLPSPRRDFVGVKHNASAVGFGHSDTEVS